MAAYGLIISRTFRFCLGVTMAAALAIIVLLVAWVAMCHMILRSGDTRSGRLLEKYVRRLAQ